MYLERIRKMKLKESLHQKIIAFNQLINAWVFNGWADETMSSRAYRLEQANKPWKVIRIVIDAIFFWQTEHCKTAYIIERNRRHSPPELRELR